MPGKHLYEYAVIRVVPKVEREEFCNVGIVLFCKRQRYLRMRCHLDQRKIRMLCQEIDLGDIQANLDAFRSICEGKPDGGPIAQMETPDRFRWLTAVRSSVIQTSRPHPGFTDDLDATLDRLFEELVL